MYRRIVTTILCGIFFLPAVLMAEDSLRRGYINEITLSTPIAEFTHGGGNNASYLALDDTLIISLKDTERQQIVLPKPFSSTYNVTTDYHWQFYGADNYAERSGTAAIHRGEVFLPDCMANICRRDGNFSVKLPNIQQTDDIRFSLDGADITAFFYYADGIYRLKEFYQLAFFDLFEADLAVLTWSDGKEEGSLSLRLGNKTIKGKLTGGAYTELIMEHAGSGLAAPHSFVVNVSPDGSFTADGLISFEYAFRTEAGLAKIELDGLSMDESGSKTLSVNLLAPHFDYILNKPPRDYDAGEFVLLRFDKWHKDLTGSISAFTQLSGDAVKYRIHSGFVAMVLPDISTSTENLAFSGRVGGKSFYLSMPNPARKPQTYEHFKLFSEEGRYARTGFTESAGGVFLKKGQKLIRAYVNTISRMDAESVKVHLYTANRTYDVTRRFQWDTATQSMASLPDYHINLYNALAGEPGSLAVTFCDADRPELCFRIYEALRPGAATLTVDLTGQSYSGMTLILRELDVSSNGIVRTLAVERAGRHSFYGLPAGEYQVILADLSLRVYGSAFVKINGEENRRVSLPIKKATSATEELITTGNVTKLPKVTLYQDDYRVVTPPLKMIDAVRRLGNIGGDYVLYSDGSLALHTYEEMNDSSGTLLLEGDGRYALLPLEYKAVDRVVNEKGMDYGMCPPERPYCRNAFVEVMGLTQGVYDGKEPLVFVMPFNINPEQFSLALEPGIDMTDMFEIDISKNIVALKTEFIPAFLSAVSQSTLPLTLRANGREYQVSLVAGFKSVEASVVTPSGDRSSVFAGMTARISCDYGETKVFSRKAEVNKDSFILFGNLPNCVYKMELVDKDRLFSGSLENLRLATGQNIIRTVFPVSCIGSNDQFLEDCRPFLPIISDNRLISPDFGVIMTDAYLADAEAATIDGDAQAVQSRLLGNGITLFVPRGAEGEATLEIKRSEKYAQLPLRIDTIHSRLVQVLSKPADAPDIKPQLLGVTSSLVYAGAVPLKLRPGIDFDYHPGEVFAEIAMPDGKLDISHMFAYVPANKELGLKDEYIAEFYRLLDSRQHEIFFSFAPFDSERHYVISMVVAAPAAGVYVDVVSPEMLSKKTGALLIGRKGNNSFEYRQYGELRDGRVSFGMVPMGIYDVVVFDIATAQFGAREISIQTPQDVDIEIGLRKFR